MSHYTLSIRPARGGVRKFAVLSQEACAKSDWSTNRDIWSQSDQTWEAKVWQRIADRGYVCQLDGGGQWANRGNHGRYIGNGATAEAALLDAWNQATGEHDDRWGGGDYCDDPPRSLIAPMRDYDATVKPVEVE